MASKPTEIMIAVSQSSMLGYPHPSLSSRRAFHWTTEKFVRSIPAGFRLLFVHVDKDATDDKDLKDKTRGLSLLEYFETQCCKLEIPCEACIRRGNPGQVICSEVQRLHPDLLVVGNRGLNLVQRIFIGTVSEYCMKHADCPVMTIKRIPAEIPEDPADD